ncbi:OmpA family protein [Phreatobacter aquaticus]|nr:OmpA family protein [Phreatobacter aquaticus]
MFPRWAVIAGLIPLAVLGLLAVRDVEPLVSEVIADRASAQLKAESLTWARVEVSGRDVVLAGEALELAARALAAPSVARVPGVRQVTDTTRLMAEQKPYLWSLETSATRAVVTGYVPSDAVRSDILRAIGAAMPGRDVVDRLQFGRGAPDGFAGTAALLAASLGSAVSGTAVINNVNVSLQAIVENEETAGIVRRAMAALSGTYRLADLQLALPRAAPYLFELERDAQGVAASGHVPGGAARGRLIAALHAAFGQQAVVDRLQDASGEPAGFEAAALFLIEQTARLNSARASVRDRVLAVEGTAPDAGAYRGVVAAWRNRMPAGFTAGAVSVTAPLITPYRLGIAVEADVVRLSGHLPDEPARDALLAALRAGGPSRSIDDRIQLGLGAPARFAEAAVQAGRLAVRMVSGEVGLSDTRLAVAGRAASFDDDEALKAEAARLPEGFTAGSLSLSPPRIAPFSWTAELAGGEVTLKGHVPSVSVRDALLTQARAVFEGRTISDQTRIADGALSGFGAAAGFGLGQLARMSEGRVAILDGRVTVTGKGQAGIDNAALAAAGARTDGLPAGFSLAATDVVAALPVSRPYIMTLALSDGRIALDGVAMSEAEKTAILEAARLALPGRAVDDRIRIATGQPDAIDWVAANRFALAQLARLSTGAVRLEDGAFRIEGQARDRAGFVAVNLAIRQAALPGGGRLHAASIRPPIVSPYGWFVEKTASGVLLQGYAPSDAVRASNRDNAMRAFQPLAVRDAQELAEGAPEGFAAAARLAIELVARLERGRADIADRSLGLAGQAVTGAEIEAVRNSLRDGLPTGWQSRDQIRVPAPVLVPTSQPVRATVPPATPDNAEQCQAKVREAVGQGTITFQLGRDQLRPEAVALVNRIALVMKECPATAFTVEGHTDSDGPSAQNLDLSERRAQAVVSLLIQQGIAAARLSPQGFGASRPLVPNDSLANKIRNRRIAFVARP